MKHLQTLMNSENVSKNIESYYRNFLSDMPQFHHKMFIHKMTPDKTYQIKSVYCKSITSFSKIFDNNIISQKSHCFIYDDRKLSPGEITYNTKYLIKLLKQIFEGLFYGPVYCRVKYYNPDGNDIIENYVFAARYNATYTTIHLDCYMVEPENNISKSYIIRYAKHFKWCIISK